MQNQKILNNLTFEMVPVDNLKINKYQRGLSVLFAKTIGFEFDANRVGVITVSYRDGQFNVLDGQHRVYGAKIAEIPMLMCHIIRGLTYQQEAELFKDLNKQRKGLLAFDYFNAGFEADEIEAIEIKEIIEMNGLTISRGSGHNLIQALRTVSNIYRKFGKEHLSTTLKFIKATWDGETKSLNNSMLKGVAEFLNVYSGEVTLGKFAKQLRRWDPEKITREADNDSSNVTKAIKTVNVIFKYYNYKLASNRLENKHFKY